MSTPDVRFNGDLQITDAWLDQLADLLLSGGAPVCELCGQHPQEHFIEHGQWAGRHCCSSCWQSLPTEGTT